MRDPDFPYLPKDFIETAEGLIFAVVSYFPEQEKVGCFLRYIRSGEGWKKVSTEEANALLNQQYPFYLFYSQQFDTSYHAVSPHDIIKHHKPEEKLIQLLSAKSTAPLCRQLERLITILTDKGADISTLGLTGSMLIDQQKKGSDIDLVVYGRLAFNTTRKAVELAIQDKTIMALDRTLMRDNFNRRAAALSYDEFAWHEYRKFNKASIEGTKFDIGMTCLTHELMQDHDQYHKEGQTQLTAMVIDDRYAFDFPARYTIDSNDISEILSFTHTYVGQAQKGESIEVAGSVESNVRTGKKRLVVGSTREAVGEYIKVKQRTLSY